MTEETYKKTNNSLEVTTVIIESKAGLLEDLQRATKRLAKAQAKYDKAVEKLAVANG